MGLGAVVALLGAACMSCATADAGERIVPTVVGLASFDNTVPTTTTTTTTTSTTTTTRPKPPPPKPKPVVPVRTALVYHGLGTWVDAFDYSPEFNNGKTPVSPDAVAGMAAAGVHTLYLQASKDDPKATTGDILDPDLVARFVTESHAHGMKIVAWYLPKFANVDLDLRRLLALANFRASGQGFDGVGVDIEWRKDVPDAADRSARLVQLSQRLRAAAPRMPLGAIVLPPVVTEVINPAYWPGFPWQGIKGAYDAWLPMAYWTFRTQSSGYRDAFKYVDENIRRLRNDLGNPAAVVHAIGGIGDSSTAGDYTAFVRALVADHAVGGSIYDWRTTAASGWPILGGSPR